MKIVSCRRVPVIAAVDFVDTAVAIATWPATYSA